MTDSSASGLAAEYRARAEECRARAQSFRGARARAQMLKLADEYELKAKQAEASELEKNNSLDVGEFGGDGPDI